MIKVYPQKTSKEKLAKLVAIRREIIIRRARETFYAFCRVEAPEFYISNRWHLVNLCNTLQALYESKLTDETGKIYHKLLINMPPRFGKTRTLVNFCKWILGKNPEERIIATSYNDDVASEFSKYTRDGIMEIANDLLDIVYSDIFPNSRIKFGSASFQKWALDGQFFNYIGAGIRGSITGKGATVRIVDDPVKDVETAMNEDALEKIWDWYIGTFQSREELMCEPIDIINMTFWTAGDITGRILDSEDAKSWYKLSYEAKNLETGEMLCPEFMDEAKYQDKMRIMSSTVGKKVFMANYHQQSIDETGLLYKNLKTYKKLPTQFYRIFNYTDTADEGDDFLASGVFGEIDGECWLLDVLYTKDGMEKTEPAMAKLLSENDVGLAKFESNNGGRGFARAVERILKENYINETKEIEDLLKQQNPGIEEKELKILIDEYPRQWKRVPITWFHQTENKLARIQTNANYIMQHFYFPENWNERWPLFYKDVSRYMREGKNKHDDAPDMLTGVAEMVGRSRPHARMIG